VIETFHILAKICELEAAEIDEADPADVPRLRAMFQRGRDPHPLVAGAASEIEALARRKDDVEHLRDLAGRLRLHIEELRRKGVEGMPIIESQARFESLAQIRQDLGDCRRCGLCQTRQSIVFGEGPESAQVAFVGEAPGADEDLSGLPFQGQAGALLDKMLDAMHKEAYRQWRDPEAPGIDFKTLMNERAGMFKRANARILNTVMCRPPLNRKPDPEEVAQCVPFLERQLMALPNLKIIVTLGATPATALLPKFKRLSDIRGRWQEWRGIPLMPTWHPAYLLRDPSHKMETWEDLKLVIERMK